MGIAIKLNNVTIAEVDSVQSVEHLQSIVCEKLVSESEYIVIPRLISIIDFPSRCRT